MLEASRTLPENRARDLGGLTGVTRSAARQRSKSTLGEQAKKETSARHARQVVGRAEIRALYNWLIAEMKKVTRENSVTKGGKEGKAMMDVSNLFLRCKLEGFCTENGSGMEHRPYDQLEEAATRMGPEKSNVRERSGILRNFAVFQ